jgi:hypothetical protein
MGALMGGKPSVTARVGVELQLDEIASLADTGGSVHNRFWQDGRCLSPVGAWTKPLPTINLA